MRDGESNIAPTKPISSRRGLGIYYTPQLAARILANWAIRTPSDSILEPSFGGCALLRAAKARLEEIGAQNPVSLLLGYDLDPDAFVHLDQIFDRNPNQFKRLDFLRSRPRGPIVNAVVANPPFISYRRMTERQRRAVRFWIEKYDWPFAKDAGLWAYFLIHSLNFLKANGRIAFILPSSINQADYAGAIRNYISKKFRQTKLIRVNQQLFIEEGTVERTSILLADGYLSEQPSVLERFELSDLNEIYDIIDSSQSESKVQPNECILDLLSSKLKPIQLGEIASTSIGEVIGDVKYFVRSLSDWGEIGISEEYCKPIVQGAATLPGLILRNTDRKYLPRLLQISTDQPTGIIASILNNYSATKREANSTFKKRKVWHKSSYNSDAIGFIPNVAGAGPRFILNNAGVSCTNSVYKVHKRGDKKWHSEALAIAMQTTLTQLSAERLSRTLGSGGLKLEPSDIKKLLLPPTALSINIKTAKKILNQMDVSFRQGRYEEIRKLADEALLLSPGIISESEYDLLTSALKTSRSRRKQIP